MHPDTNMCSNDGCVNLGPHPQPPGGSQQPSTPTEMLLHYTRTLMERLLMDALRDSTTTPPLLPQQVPILALDEQGTLW